MPTDPLNVPAGQSWQDPSAPSVDPAAHLSNEQLSPSHVSSHKHIPDTEHRPWPLHMVHVDSHPSPPRPRTQIRSLQSDPVHRSPHSHTPSDLQIPCPLHSHVCMQSLPSSPGRHTEHVGPPYCTSHEHVPFWHIPLPSPPQSSSSRHHGSSLPADDWHLSLHPNVSAYRSPVSGGVQFQGPELPRSAKCKPGHAVHVPASTAPSIVE